MINYSRRLIEVARAVLADGYYDCQNMQPDDLAVFQQSVASRAPEVERFTFNELRELVEAANSRDERDPDYEWVDDDQSTTQDVEENEEETFEEDEEEGEESVEPVEDLEDPVVKAQEDKRRSLEAVNRVLNVYYPYKTLSAATDFDRLRALFAEEVPDLAENISDERLKMLLFAVGGTLIGQLRPREERLAEAKRREANPDAFPSARSYESKKPSQPTPGTNVYESYNKLSGAEDENDSTLNGGSDSNESSLDAQAEAITRTFNSPRARLSQIRQNSPFRKSYETPTDESNNGYGADSNVGERAPSQRYDGAPSGYPSRYGERPNYGERPPRQGYGAPYERQGYERQSYDRYGSERQGYGRPGYDRGEYSERPYGSDRYNAPSRSYYNERPSYPRQGYSPRYNGGYSNGSYSNGGYSNDGYQNGRSYDSNPNGYVSNGRPGGYPGSGYRNSYSNGGYANNGYSRAQGYSSLQEYRNNRTRSINEPFGAGSSSEPTAFDPTNPPLADVVRAVREILTNYFPGRQVRLGSDFRRLRILTGFKFPQANFSDDKLQMFVAYSGGSLLGSSRDADGETLLEPTDYSTRKEDELREVATQVLRFFPGGLVDEGQGFEKFRVLFNARFDEGSVSVSDETLKKIIRAAGGILPGQTEAQDVNVDVDERFAALVDVAKTILETKFSHSVFQRDLSDFTRFRIQFERLAGPGAILDDAELRDVFLRAGGVFEEEPKQEVKPVVKLARSVMIKKVVAENFPNGMDGASHDDLDIFRRCAKDYDFNFDEETDVKLSAIVARCCVHYDDKLFAIPEEGKEKIKNLVDSLFSVGTQVIYYDTYFEKNSDWLKEYNVGCVGLLVTLLANYFSDYLFYPDYFEKTECEDSERVKVMREIERVWGAAESMTPDALAERLYVPTERIRKALEISVGNYTSDDGEAFVHASAPSRSTVDDEDLDDQFDACFEDSDEEESAPLLDEENFEEEEDEEEEVSKDDEAVPSLFDMLLKEAEEENVPVAEVEDESDEESEVSQEELDAQQETLAELLRDRFPEGFDVASEDDLSLLKGSATKDARALVGSDAQILEQIKNCFLLSDGRYFAVTEEAKNRVGELLDERFEDGGRIIYYEIFWKKRRSELEGSGVFNEQTLVDVMKEARPNFVYYDSYLEPIKSDESEHAKVKAEILRFWVADTARRTSEFETPLYIPKATVAETFKNDADFTSSSNGYWTKTKSAKSKTAKTSKTAASKSGTKKSASKKS